MTCDVCGRIEYISEDEAENDNRSINWRFASEVGDLCPVCKNVWEDWKTTFVTKMRKENKGDLK